MFLSHHYAQHLPKIFSTPVTPSAFPNPTVLAFNEPLAQSLEIDSHWLHSPEGIAFLSHGQRPDGHSPVAMAYAGHQFGHFVPSLGDGRALLVGEVQHTDGTLYDMHIKGAGRTPFSRGGDGKCALGPALREYSVSEAMAALGVPTSRALAVLTTGEMIERDGQQVTGAVVVRVAKSHIRVGTFQYAATQGDAASVRALADFTLERLFPSIDRTDPHRFQHMLRQLVQRHASLVARWMGIGFIHGVLNTDNCTLSGETLDYGPCAFLDTYDPLKTFSFIDQNGRYAYGRQPHIILWNLCRFAECILPLLHSDEDHAISHAQDILKEFDSIFHQEWMQVFRHKLGLEREEKTDSRLLEHFLETMHKGNADFTATFRALSAKDAVMHDDYRAVRHTLQQHHGHMDLCRTELIHRVQRETRSPDDRYTAMQATNPRLIPRNHQIERVIKAAEQGDMAPFHQLNAALRTPFATESTPFDRPPQPDEHVRYTFCGT